MPDLHNNKSKPKLIFQQTYVTNFVADSAISTTINCC